MYKRVYADNKEKLYNASNGEDWKIAQEPRLRL